MYYVYSKQSYLPGFGVVSTIFSSCRHSKNQYLFFPDFL